MEIHTVTGGSHAAGTPAITDTSTAGISETGATGETGTTGEIGTTGATGAIQAISASEQTRHEMVGAAPGCACYQPAEPDKSSKPDKASKSTEQGHKSTIAKEISLQAVICFSDGSCPRNGQPGARASFAVVFAGGALMGQVLRGEVAAAQYAFIDAKKPEEGFAATTSAATPTNNRGEYMGVCYALLTLLRADLVGSVELVSDSLICIRTLLEWLPARRLKGTAHKLSNYDLVVIAERLLEAVKAKAHKVSLTHVRSHMKAPATGSDRDKLMWKGNAAADSHAALALTERKTPEYTISHAQGWNHV
jgi:ribonuclease HI